MSARLADIVEVQMVHYEDRTRDVSDYMLVANELLENGWQILAVAATPGYECDGARVAPHFTYCMGRPSSAPDNLATVTGIREVPRDA